MFSARPGEMFDLHFWPDDLHYERRLSACVTLEEKTLEAADKGTNRPKSRVLLPACLNGQHEPNVLIKALIFDICLELFVTADGLITLLCARRDGDEKQHLQRY